MTDDDKVRLRELLLRPDMRVNGKISVSMAMKMTGLSYNAIMGFMRRDPYLHAQVAEANPGKLVPEENELIDAAVPAVQGGMMITKDEWDKAQAVLRQQRKMLASDWKGLGMDDAMAQRMENLSRMGTAPLLPVMNMLYGGLIKHVASLDEVLERDSQRIKDNLLPSELDKEGMPAEDGKVQREWRYCWYAGYKLHLELFNSMQKTQAMLARVMREMQALGMGAKPEAKGVFEANPSERKPDAA